VVYHKSVRLDTKPLEAQDLFILSPGYRKCLSSPQDAVSTIKVMIWNEEPLMGFEMSLRAWSYLYISLAAVY
jgi:hypothetical protein